MKLYRTSAGFHGTQAEAKSFSKEYEQVEVPTDKPGLIAYLNQMHNAQQDREDEFTAIVERQDPEVPGEDTVVSHAQRTVDLDSAFLAAPLGQQLTLAAIAVENARSRIGRETAPNPAPQGYAGKVERAAPADDDELFA